ncbi:MAG: hypothetical protein ACE5KM_12270 [Planctomycetaceae bacterium]
MILAFGILGLTVCAIFGPFAWVMGNTDLAEIEAGRMDPTGEGLTRAGKITGMIATILVGALILFYIVLFAFLIAAG